jgi:hypothetical protein
MRKIKLTQGKVALVDNEDFNGLNKYKWYAQKGGLHTYYAGRKTLLPNGKQVAIYMHREILGTPQTLLSDHINGNGLDNQRNNLRVVTARQNRQNLHSGNRTSAYPGVSWHKHGGKWTAQLGVKDTVMYLGLFASEKQAFDAYCEAVAALGDAVLGQAWPHFVSGGVE